MGPGKGWRPPIGRTHPAGLLLARGGGWAWAWGQGPGPGPGQGWPGVRGKSLARGYGPGSGKGVGARVWQGIGADKVSGASTPTPYGLQNNNVNNVNILSYLTDYV